MSRVCGLAMIVVVPEGYLVTMGVCNYAELILIDVMPLISTYMPCGG
jgi:hypothetical protein